MKIDVFKFAILLTIFVFSMSCSYALENQPNQVGTQKNWNPIELNLTQITQAESNSQDNPIFVPEEQPLSKEAGQVSLFGSWLNGNYAFGNLGGLRNKFENSGLKIYGSYLNDNFMKIYGGKNPQNEPEFEGLTGIAAEADTQKLHLWPGGKGYLLFDNNAGVGISDSVGALQIVNDYDAPPLTKLMEYWYQQSLFQDLIKVKGGKQDANTDFDALAIGNLFVNNAFTFSQNIPLPTFPATRTGVSGSINFINQDKFLSLKAGWQHSIKTNSFDISEIDYGSLFKNLPGKYLYGMWIDTSSTPEVEPAGIISSKLYSNNYGVYTGFQQMLYRKNKDKDYGLVALGRFGWAPADRNIISENYLAGLAYKGLNPKRGDDIIGIGTGIAQLSGNLRSAGYKNESMIELFYKFQITPWVFLQPDFQFIVKPAGIYKNAYVLGVRISFLI